MNQIRKIWILTALMLIIGIIPLWAVPNRPNLLAPADKDSCVTKLIMFVWQQEASINNYSLQIASDAAFNTMICDEQMTATFINYNLPDYNTKYWWRVIVSYQNGTKDTSDVHSFKVKYSAPTDVYPADIQNCVPTNMTFSWTRPEGTNKYRLQVADSSDFSNLRLDTTVMNVSSFDWKAPENSHTYFWRICTVIRSTCSSEWSPLNRFATAYKPPYGLVPADSAFGCEQTVQLDWNYNLENESFSLKVSENADMSNPFINVENLAASNFTLNNLALNKTYYWQVNAVVNGCSSDWTSIHRFTVKYPSPELISPNTDAVCIPQTAQFLWHAVPMARGYSILVSQSAEFSDTTAFVVNINDTTAVVELPVGTTEYFWKVKADDSRNFGNYSAYNLFTTTYAAPKLLTPINSGVNAFSDSIFFWNSSYSGKEFIFQIAKANDFSSGNVIVNDTVNGIITDLAVNSYGYRLNDEEYGRLEKNSYYYWRVKVIDEMNCNGMWSSVFSFHTPLGAPKLISPSSQAEDISLSPTFSWSSVSGADNYDIQVAKCSGTNPEFDADGNLLNIVKESYQINATQITLSGLEAETRYYWRVRARGNGGVSVWTTPGNIFKTKIAEPAAPTLISPANNSVKVPLDNEFVWSPVDRADSFEIVISTDPRAETGIVKRLTTDSAEAYISGLVVYTNYYWKVTAINVGGRSPWSQIFTFRTIAPVLTAAPNLLSPDNDAQNLEKQVTMKWSAVATCTNYRLQLSETADFASTVIDDATLSKQVYDYISPEFNKTYYWRVLGINEVGSGPWSEIRSFTVKNSSGVADEAAFEVKISPNPVKNSLHLAVSGNMPDGFCRVKITDGNGAVLISEDYPAIPTEIRTAGLASGIYLLTIESGGRTRIVEKFTVIK